MCTMIAIKKKKSLKLRHYTLPKDISRIHNLFLHDQTWKGILFPGQFLNCGSSKKNNNIWKDHI